jgi:hypothetical protein
VSHNVTVTALDAYGNTATGYTGTVTWSSNDPQAALPANYTFTTGIGGDNGVHIFSATLKTTGTRSLTVTDTVTSTITGSQGGITVNPAGASSLVVAGFPSPTTAGVSHNVTVTALDAYGNTATGYTGTVTWSSNDPQAALPANYTFTTGSGGDNGVHTFTATLKTAGTRSLTATDTVTNTITGSQGGITVNPAGASSLVVAGFPSPTTAGVSHNVTVTALDAYGNTATGYNGTVTWSSTDPQAALPANYKFTTGSGGDNGVHTFAATLKTAGTRSLTATETVTSTITGSQSGITVNPAAATTLAVTGFPSPTTAGVNHNLTVTALDAYGNTATSYTGTVHFTTTDGLASLPADYTFTSGSGSDNGVHAFSVTLKTAGTRSVTATDKATSTITGSQSNITVNAAAAASLVVAGFPSSTTAGVSHSLGVTAFDAYGNVATGYTGTVHFTSSDVQPSLPADYTFTSGKGSDNGIHSFSAVLKTAGTQSLTATDTATASVTGTQSGITVNPAAVSALVVGGYPSPTISGKSHSFSVIAVDPYGNTVTTYTGRVHFTSSDSVATLPGNYTFTASDKGVHSFNATLVITGTQSITSTDTVTASIKGSQTGILVQPSSFSVQGFPFPTTAGVSHSFTVTALNSSGTTATAYTGTVHFTSNDGQAVLPADYTFTTGSGADNGIHTFSATLKTVGTRNLTATDTTTSAVTGTQSGITVNPAAASTFVVSGYSSPTTAGTSHSNLKVTAMDPYGNTATGYRGTVTFTSNDSQASLPGNYTFVSGDNGAHTFTATLKTAGTRSITATDTNTSSITGTQSGITVNPAAAKTLSISAPTSVTHGKSFTFTVTALDAYGNVATGYTGTIHFKSSDSKAALPANYTFTGTDAGVHTFTATLNTTGTQSITATDTATGSITATQNGISVAFNSPSPSAWAGINDDDDEDPEAVPEQRPYRNRPDVVVALSRDDLIPVLSATVLSDSDYQRDWIPESAASTAALAAVALALRLLFQDDEFDQRQRSRIGQVPVSKRW